MSLKWILVNWVAACRLRLHFVVASRNDHIYRDRVRNAQGKLAEAVSGEV